MTPESPYAIVEIKTNLSSGKMKVGLWCGGGRSEKLSLETLNELVDLFNCLHGEGYRLTASNQDSDGSVSSYVFERAENRHA